MTFARGPLGLKQPKPKKNPVYLAAIHELPCCICEAWGMPQLSPTTAHHVTHGRGGNLKTDDTRAIPLCEGHHQGNFDTSKIALHRQPDAWREAYGPDTDWTAPTQDKLAHLLADNTKGKTQ